MTSLMDITVATETVKVQGQDVEVRGLGLTDLGHLVVLYPEIKALLTGGGSGLSLDNIIEKFPGLLVDVIVCGTGNRGDAQARAKVDTLPIDEQINLFEGVLKASFKASGGAGPFVARLTALLGLVTDDGIKELASNLPKRRKS